MIAVHFVHLLSEYFQNTCVSVTSIIQQKRLVKAFRRRKPAPDPVRAVFSDSFSSQQELTVIAGGDIGRLGDQQRCPAAGAGNGAFHR